MQYSHLIIERSGEKTTRSLCKAKKNSIAVCEDAAEYS